MKKKIALMGVAIVLALTAVIGGTLASLNATTEGGAGTAVSQIKTKTLTITTSGTTTGSTELSSSFAPGGTYVQGLNVANGATASDYTLYAKVTLYKNWTMNNTKNTKETSLDADVSSFALSDGKGGYTKVDSSTTLPYLMNGWLVTYVDSEQMVMYYTKPLSGGQSSSNYLDAIVFNPAMDNSFADQSLNLNYEVAAVQAGANENAMQAEWGVFPLFASDGTLVNVYETSAARDAQK